MADPTYSFDPALSTDKDKVRLLIGDTDVDDWQLADEAIAYFLALDLVPVRAAARAADALAAHYARLTSVTIGDTSESAGQAFDHYRMLAKELRDMATDDLVPIPVAGGMTHDQKRTVEEDVDRVPPFFTRDLMAVTGPVGTGFEREV